MASDVRVIRGGAWLSPLISSAVAASTCWLARLARMMNRADRKPGDDLSLGPSFKAAMRRLSSSVTIVSTRDGESRWGMTATAVTSLSADPPSVLVCVNRGASIRAHLRSEARLCVNLLSSEHAALSRAFSGEVEPERRFELGNWDDADDGIPYLCDAMASLFCEIDQLIEYGSHSVAVGRVYSVKLGPSASPLIYGDGRFLDAT